MLKDTIKQYDKCTDQINKLEAELLFVQSKVYNTTSNLSEAVVQGGVRGKGFEDNVILEKEISERINAYCLYRKRKREAIEYQIKDFEEAEQDIVRLKVFGQKTWQEVGVYVNLSDDRVRHIYYNLIKK